MFLWFDIDTEAINDVKGDLFRWFEEDSLTLFFVRKMCCLVAGY